MYNIVPKILFKMKTVSLLALIAPASAKSLTAIAVDPSGAKLPLALCKGDCDKDAHCKAGLKCYQRNGKTSVPGCDGSGKSDYDYCIDPADFAKDSTTLTDYGWTPAQYNLGRCKGDCDKDAHCKAGLKCYHRNVNDLTSVPGCD